MAKLPLVAIIGRPNTGKSTLFNALVGRRIAIESDIAGTTRDHIARKVKINGVQCLLVDTGGMGGGTDDHDFEDDVHSQSLLALEAADVILFVLNAREELTSSDREIIQLLRKKSRRHVPAVIVFNKSDSEELATEAVQTASSLGLSGDMVAVSAANKVGVPDLREVIAKALKGLHFEESEEPEEPEEMDDEEGWKGEPTEAPAVPRIALVGKPNVGKSSILNAFMSPEQRKTSPKLVSPISGTTRDSTDTLINHEGTEYVFVDTAGLRRPSRVEQDLEGLSALRSYQAIEEADVVLLVLDANEPVSKQDKRIAQYIIEEGKGLIILLNKIDMLKGEEKIAKVNEVRGQLLFCRYAPVLSCSAVTRDGLLKVFPLLGMVHRNRYRRIDAKGLHRFFEDAVLGKPMSSLASAKHLTQAKDPPPTFVLFVKRPGDVQVSQLRYLENRMREMFGLEGTPIKWVIRAPGRGKKE